MGHQKKQQTPEPSALQVGDRVRLRFVLTDVEAIFTEDRGHLGVGGRRLWGNLSPWGDEETYLELPTERLTRIEEPAESH